MHLSRLGRALQWGVSAFVMACARDESLDEVLARRGVPPAVPGCYALAAGYDTVALRRAHAFRLDAHPVSDAHPELHPATSLVDSIRERLSAWSADSLSDTVRVSIGDGFTGVTVLVVSSPSGLRGRAVGFGDAGPSEWKLGDVVYNRRGCSHEGHLR